MTEQDINYMTDSTLMGHFVKSCCRTGDSLQCDAPLLFDVFFAWWERFVGNHPPRWKKFGAYLRTRFRCEKVGTLFRYYGIGLDHEFIRDIVRPPFVIIPQTVLGEAAPRFEKLLKETVGEVLAGEFKKFTEDLGQALLQRGDDLPDAELIGRWIVYRRLCDGLNIHGRKVIAHGIVEAIYRHARGRDLVLKDGRHIRAVNILLLPKGLTPSDVQAVIHGLFGTDNH